VRKDQFNRLRKAAGHTQATLAREMGVHLRTVTRWEIGEIIIPRVVELALRYIAEHAKKSPARNPSPRKHTRMDGIDLAVAKAALLEAKKTGTISWEKMKKDLGLKRRPKKHQRGNRYG
jgi:DNA-binding XRE family transcriptional regulator